MLIVTENEKITAVDKNFLNESNIDFDELSNFINTLQLQISSLQNNELTINFSKFKVTYIDTVSLKNIKIFDLTLLNEQQSNQIPELHKEFNEFKIEPKIEQTEETETFEKINLTTPAEEETQKAKPFEINLIKEEIIQNKEPEPIIEKEIKTKLEIPKPEDIEAEKIVSINETPNVSIEISFEDDLEEINTILASSKEKFKNSIHQELKKASEELSIDLNDLSELYEQLIKQIKNDKKEIYSNIDKKDYESLHKNYHKLKGAALNLRLTNIALVLKKLDELSKSHEDIHKIEEITNKFYTLIENKSDFKPDALKTSDSSDKKIEDIVLKTIKTYLATQNEAQFQKDKRYIEKLLNTQINSLNELEKILKGK